jgi:hypothetical protein
MNTFLETTSARGPPDKRIVKYQNTLANISVISRTQYHETSNH